MAHQMFALYGRHGEKIKLDAPLHATLPPAEAPWPQPHVLRRHASAPGGVRMDEGDLYTNKPTFSNHDPTLGTAAGISKHGSAHKDYGGFADHRRTRTGALRTPGSGSSRSRWGEESSAWQPHSPTASQRSTPGSQAD